MRSFALLALLGAALLAGCTSPSPPPAAEAPPPEPMPEATTETGRLDFQLLASVGMGTDLPVLFWRADFIVPEGTVHFIFNATWDCITMCPLAIQLVDGSGEVAAEGEGGFDATLEVESPASGDWFAYFFARDGATAGTQGSADLTFHVVPPA